MHGASPRFYCGFTQTTYGPRTDRNLRFETSAGPAVRCDHTDLRSIYTCCSRSANGCSWGCFHLWLFPLSLRKPLPTPGRRTATARSDDDMFFVQLGDFILRRYTRRRAKTSLNSSPLRCGSQKLNPGAPQEVLLPIISRTFERFSQTYPPGATAPLKPLRPDY